MKNIIYLDNAATTQISQPAIDAIHAYWNSGRSNVGRGLYPLVEEAMNQYESARSTIAQFVGADASRCVFTKSVTEGLNLVAFGISSTLNPGDEILLSPFEHHANILPWRRIAEERGAIVRTMPMTADFMLDLDGALAMMNERTKIVAVTLVSNVLGTIVPIAEFTRAIHALPLSKGELEGVAPIIIVDAAQAAPHIPINITDLGADALVFSSHKCYGPAGIAALILSKSLIETLEPMVLGGGMVDSVKSDSATWKTGPEKFEGGSPNVEGAIGFAAALRAIEYSNNLRSLLTSKLQSLPSVTIFNPPSAVAIVAFTVANLHPHDVADMLGKRGVCIRAGHCCAAPLVERLSPNGILRVSLGRGNTKEDIEKFIDELSTIISFTSI